MNHKTLLGQDLTGWKLATAYLLELKHGLMGFFPAEMIDVDGKEDMFLCLDKDLLLQVAKLLPPRQSVMTEFMVLVNESLGLAFDLGILQRKIFRDEPVKDNHIKVLTRQRFEELKAGSKDKKPFKWTSGLIGNDMSSEEFIETLTKALEKAG
ncbi:MAG: hypothetical protein WC310_00115 [Patescibacteria group bacterium]